jgi:hypothetical protein
MPRGTSISSRRPTAASIALFSGLAAALLLPGCVRRTIRITSDPSGALVWVNSREVGRTPVDFDFVHYGTYDVRLVRDGHEPLLTYGEAKPPLWDQVGLDFFAELAPMDLESTIEWHFTMTPRPGNPETERAELLDRARELREVMVGEDRLGEGGLDEGGLDEDGVGPEEAPPVEP